MKHSLLIAASLLVAGLAAAQTAPAYKINMGKVNIQSQPTPMIQASNVIDKRWKPKEWLELDTELEVKLPTTEGPEATLASLEVKYFLVTSAADKDGRRIVLKGAVVYTNVPSGVKSHVLAFVSPATLKSALKKDNGGKADIVAYAVVTGDGSKPDMVVSQGPGGAKWWESLDPTKFTIVDGGVLGKNKTPFAPFWGDYDLIPLAN
jgi:hypothetical protein